MIVRRSAAEIDSMRRAGRVVADVLAVARETVMPGVTTSRLDEIADGIIRSAGCIPSFKGYRGFPASICVSLNDEIIHGIPGPRVIGEGDLVKIDAGACHDGLHADAAVTVYCGAGAPPEVEKLIRVTEEALAAGISQARDGRRIGDISAAVQFVAEGAGFSVVRGYTGHGIGRALHEDPDVPNHGSPRRGPRLRAGYTLAIEPMVNLGGHESVEREDGWTVATSDGSLSAHAEHTVVVTEGDPLILTAK